MPRPAPVLLEKRCLNLLGAGTVGVSIVALGRCIRRIGEVDLIHIDIVELGEGQRHLLVPTAQIDLDSIAGASYGAINGIDDLNRIFRSDEQLDIGADTLKVISAGTLEPIDDIVDVVAGIFEQALVADGLEVPISVEAVAVGIRLNVAALAESGLHVPAAELSGFLHGIIRIEMAVLVCGIIRFRAVQQIAIACLVEQVVFQTDAVHSSSRQSGWSHSNHRARHKLEIPTGHK